MIGLSITEEHHRRPRSLDGSNDRANISNVTPRQHKHWHTLFGNMNAYQICEKINSRFAPEGLHIMCEFINGHKVEKEGKHSSNKKGKCENAWKQLFKNMSFAKAIEYINNVWLDASYHFYVVED